MTTFRLTREVACWVTWVFEVDAKNEAEAREKFDDGEGILMTDGEIGDSLDGIEVFSTITQVTP